MRRLYLVSAFLVFAASAAADTGPRLSASDIGLKDPIFDGQDAFCRAPFNDPDDDTGRLEFLWSVNGARVGSQIFASVSEGSVVEANLDSRNYDEGDQLKCEVQAFDDFGQPDQQMNSSFKEYIIRTDPPNVTRGPVFTDYPGSHRFNVSARVRDLEGDDDITSCRVRASDGDGNVIDRSMEIDYGFGDSLTARCSYSNINNYTEGFEPTERLRVRVSVTDTDADSNFTERFHRIPNSAPEVFNVVPQDDSRTVSDSVELSAAFTDQDGEDMTVKFINVTGPGSEVLAERSDFSGGTFSYEWGDLRSLKNYFWRINVSDGYSVTSRDLAFRNLVSSVFRVQTEIDYRYSTLITSEDNSRIVEFLVRNTDDERKSLRSTITGVNAEFVRDGSRSLDYTVSPDSSKRLPIRVSYDGTGSWLNVTTQNREFDVFSRASMPVSDREVAGSIPELPGISLLQLLVLLSGSFLYYSLRL